MYCSVYKIYIVGPAKTDECVGISSVELLSIGILSNFFPCFTQTSGCKPTVELLGGRADMLRLGTYCQIIPQSKYTNRQRLPEVAVSLGLHLCRLCLGLFDFSHPSEDVMTSLHRFHLFFFLITKEKTLDFMRPWGQHQLL